MDGVVMSLSLSSATTAKFMCRCYDEGLNSS